MADRYLLESGAPDGYLLEDSSGVLILEGADAAQPRGGFFVNGHAGVAMLGAAIGAVAIWSGVEIQPRFEQPKPQVSQWEFATRQHDQRAPQIWRQQLTAAAAAPQPTGQFFARPQADPAQAQPVFGKVQPGNLAPASRQFFARPGFWETPQPYTARYHFPAAEVQPHLVKPWFVAPQHVTTQPQPQLWRQQLDLVLTSAGYGTLSPNQDPFQPQPQYWRQQLTSAAPAAQPTKAWFARGQDDTTQTQPRFWRAQPGNLAPAPGQWFATRQDDPSQKQPQVWRLQFANVAPPGGQWFAIGRHDQTQPQPKVWKQQLTGAQDTPAARQFFAAGQADPRQLQPLIRGQVPSSQAPDTPATRPWFAFPQFDPSIQRQPSVLVANAALLPSVPAPVVDDFNSGGWPIYAARERLAELRAKREREEKRLAALEEEQAERERLLVRARSDAAKEKESLRLAKARAHVHEQERLLALLVVEITMLLRAQEDEAEEIEVIELFMLEMM